MGPENLSHVSSWLGTLVENHCSKGCRARAGDLGFGGTRGHGRRACLCPGWDSGSLVQRKFHNHIVNICTTQKGPLTSL